MNHIFENCGSYHLISVFHSPCNNLRDICRYLYSMNIGVLYAFIFCQSVLPNRQYCFIIIFESVKVF